MKIHTYNGEKFKVQDGLSKFAADQFCAQLLAYRNRSRTDSGETYFEVDRMPTDHRDSQTPPKKRGRPRKVIAPSVNAKPGETVTVPVESTLYAEGFYRVACATCQKGIPLTGKRGRAPKYHVNCRPESE